MNKTLLYLIYFAAYSAVLLVIGKSSLRDSDSISKFFMCGRQLPLWRCVCTFAGTWISAASILSLTGSVYESGLSAMVFSVVPWFLGALLIVLVSDRLYATGVTTVPELFRVRYGSKGLQAAYGVLLAAVYVLYLVIQIKGFGIVASTLFGIPYSMAILLVYLFILYTSFGGYQSVTRSDVFNLILMIVGLGVLLVTVVARVGSLGGIYAGAAEVAGYAHRGMAYATEAGDLLKPFGQGDFAPLMSISMFFGWGLGLAVNPQYAVRILASRDARSARRMIWISLGLLAVIYFTLSSIGLGMRVLIPTVDATLSTDEIFTYILNNDLYSGWSGFLLFAILGACISTANSQLLLIASSCSCDVVGALWPRPLKESTLVNLSRGAVMAGGTLSLLLALSPPASLLTYGGDVWGVFSVTLLAPMFGTLLWKGTTLTGVYAALGSGLAALAVFYPPYYQGVLPFHPALPGTLISIAALWLGSLLSRKKEADA